MLPFVSAARVGNTVQGDSACVESDDTKREPTCTNSFGIGMEILDTEDLSAVETKGDRERRSSVGSLPSSFDLMATNATVGMNVESSTVRDVARLAGVSCATVSRVLNDESNVSDKTRSKVLAAISQLRYHRNAHAAELRRGKGSNPSTRTSHLPSSDDAKSEAARDLRENPQQRHWRKERSRLVGEYSKVRRLVARIGQDLDKLKSIVQ